MPNCLVGHRDTPLGQHVLGIAETEMEGWRTSLLCQPGPQLDNAPCPAYIPATTYFVNAEPASLSEAGPSAT